MKLLYAFLFIILTGCDVYVEAPVAARALEFCRAHEGLLYINYDTLGNRSFAVCNDRWTTPYIRSTQ